MGIFYLRIIVDVRFANGIYILNLSSRRSRIDLWIKLFSEFFASKVQKFIIDLKVDFPSLQVDRMPDKKKKTLPTGTNATRQNVNKSIMPFMYILRQPLRVHRLYNNIGEWRGKNRIQFSAQTETIKSYKENNPEL